MSLAEFATAWVIKTPAGKYLADRIHHMPLTRSLARALLFDTEERAERIAKPAGYAAQQIILAEYEAPDHPPH